MNTREFLEQDKERLKTRLGAAADAEEAAVICEDELNRILFRYNEQVPSDTMRKAASATLTTIRSALRLWTVPERSVPTNGRFLPEITRPAGGLHWQSASHLPLLPLSI